jgi:hypothetical protein
MALDPALPTIKGMSTTNLPWTRPQRSLEPVDDRDGWPHATSGMRRCSAAARPRQQCGGNSSGLAKAHKAKEDARGV